MMDEDGLNFDFSSPLDKESKELYNSRELLIFVIDCSDSMFETQDDEESYFKRYLRACRSVLMRKIIGSSSDYIGIIFYGTREKDDGNHNPNHVLTFCEPKQPNADIIKEIDSLLSSSDSDFSNKYGHSNDYSVSDVLWRCSSHIGRCTVNFGSKKLILITCHDHPHKNDLAKQHHVHKRAEDLRSLRIRLDVIGVGNNFDGDLFYNEILRMVSDSKAEIQKGSIVLQQLEKGDYRKDCKKRSFANLVWEIGNDVSIAVEAYGFYRSLTTPAIKKLCRKTNEITKSVTQIYDGETGEQFLKSDLNYKIEVNGEPITFSIDEKDDLRVQKLAGIKTLGFKSIGHLTPEYFKSTSSFIYPNDSTIEGSSKLFTALLESCYKKGKFVLCYFLSRLRSKPKLVALVPQREIQDGGVQIFPPGFHVLYLPYADNLRDIEIPPAEKLDQYYVDLWTKICKKLRIKYKVSLFENPKVQNHWASIEALALNYPDKREITDKTMVDYEMISNQRLKDLETTFTEVFYKDGYDPETDNVRKRTYPSSSKSNKTQDVKRAKIDPNDPNYVEKMATDGQLAKLTVAVMREYLEDHHIPTKGFRKADYVNAICNFLDSKT